MMLAGLGAEFLLKAKVCWCPLAKVPFAKEPGRVAPFFQSLGKGDLIGRKELLFGLSSDDLFELWLDLPGQEVSKAEARGVFSGENTGTGR